MYEKALPLTNAGPSAQRATSVMIDRLTLDLTQPWQDPAGAWSDLPEDDEAETFYRMRHETAPSAPIEL